MTDFPAYTRDEWDERARSIIRALQYDANGTRNADITPGGDYDITARLLGSIGFLLQETGNSGRRALEKARSFGAFLREHASIAGVGATLQETTQAAVKATGKVVVRASTTATQSLAAGSTLTTADGVQYTVDSTVSSGVFAARSFTTGHRSKRDFVFYGGSAISVTGVAEIYEYAPTGELWCPRAGSIAVDGYQYSQPHVPLVNDPALGDSFSRVAGVVVDVTAVVAGSAGNREPRDALFMSPWSGTFSQAQVLYVDGGRDALTTSQMQQALRDLYADRMDVFSLEQLRRLALKTPRTDLREVFIYPGEHSFSAKEYALMPIGKQRSLCTAYDGVEVANHMNAMTPGVEQFEWLSTRMRSVEWMITARVSPDFAPDWKYNTNFDQTFAGVSTTTRLKHTLALPVPLLSVGDRILVSIARGGAFGTDPCLLERKVTAIGSDYLDIDPPLPYTPSRVIVSQSGPFGDDLIASIDAFFDNQAPHIPDQYRYPSPDSVSVVDAFSAAMTAVPGMVDVVVTEPGGAAVLDYLEIFYPKSITVQVWTS